MLYRYMPEFIFNRFFGNRRLYGNLPKDDDPEWRMWLTKYSSFYEKTQRSGLGKLVNNEGYKVLKYVDLKEKNVVEIGPGSLNHISFWKNKPKKFYAIDISENFLIETKTKLDKHSVCCETILTVRNNNLIPIKSNSIDIFISFYSLEHILELDKYLNEVKRIAKPGALFIGAIPAEGGFFYGLGRYLTTRRFAYKKLNINYDKIICWEHPNFADQIITKLDKVFTREKVNFFPFNLFTDISLVIKFIYKIRK